MIKSRWPSAFLQILCAMAFKYNLYNIKEVKLFLDVDTNQKLQSTDCFSPAVKRIEPITPPAPFPDLLGFLLSRGALPDIQDKRGRTPAMLAAELGLDAAVELLAESRADLTLLDTEGKGENKAQMVDSGEMAAVVRRIIGVYRR